MSDPNRLLEEGANGFERQLLSAALTDGPTRDARGRLLVSLGAGAATTTAATSAGGAGATGALSTATKAWALKSLCAVALTAAAGAATVRVVRSSAERGSGCANQEAANEACPTSATLQCAPDPFAGQGSDPAGHCSLEAVCPAPDAGSTPITYTGGCTQGSCAGQAAANAECPRSATLQCVPDPAAGQGSDPAGHCNLEAVCASPDAG